MNLTKPCIFLLILIDPIMGNLLTLLAFGTDVLVLNWEKLSHMWLNVAVLSGLNPKFQLLQ